MCFLQASTTSSWILSTILARDIDWFLHCYLRRGCEQCRGKVLPLAIQCSQIFKSQDEKMGKSCGHQNQILFRKGLHAPSNQDHYFRIVILIKISQKCRKYIDFFIVIILPRYHLIPSALSCLHWSSSTLSLSKTQPGFMLRFQFLFIFFGFSFRLTLEVCFILMSLSQKA